MFFFKKQQSQSEKNRARRSGAEPAAAPERFVTVHVTEAGRGQFARAYLLPASHLARPRLAPLVAQAEEEYGVQHRHQQGGGDVIRVACRHRDFVDAMVWTAVEEAAQGRMAHGEPTAPPVDDGCGNGGERHDLGWYLARPH